MGHMIRLVLSDIDGTLLPFHQWYIDEATRDAIDGLEAAGIKFGPASGRPIADINKAMVKAEYSNTCVASDGMVVSLDGQIIVDKHLPNDQIQHVADAMPTDIGAAIAVGYNVDDNPKEFITWAVIGISEGAKKALDPHVKYDNYPLFVEAVPKHKLYVSGVFGPLDDSAKDAADTIVNDASENLHMLRTAPGYYDVCLKDWNKADGAKALLAAMNITENEVVFMGDSNNDLSLFGLFENSFCVESGTNEAKAAARWIMPDPQDGGAIAVLNALAKYDGDLKAALAYLKR